MFASKRPVTLWLATLAVLAAAFILLFLVVKGSLSNRADASADCGRWQLFSELDAAATAEYRGLVIEAVAPFSENNVWFMGRKYVAGNGSSLRFFHWNGHTLESRYVSPFEEDINIHGVTSPSGDDIWAVGSAKREGRYQAISYHWDGSSWTDVPVTVEGAERAILRGVVAVAPDDIWAVGDRGNRSLVMHWTGSQWQVVPGPHSPHASDGLTNLAAVSANDIWAIGGSQAAGVEGLEGRHPYAIHWNGKEWRLAEMPSGWRELNAITVGTDKRLWIMGADAQGMTVSAARDLTGKSANWQVMPLPKVGGYDRIFHLAASSPDTIWATGSTYYDKSPDDGAAHAFALYFDGVSWVQRDFPAPLYTQTLNTLASLPSGELWASGSYYAEAEDTPSYPLVARLEECP